MSTDEKKLPVWDASIASSYDESSCRWPGCTRPRAPSSGGRRPAYCGAADEGYLAHTSTAAQHARKRGPDAPDDQIDLASVGDTARQGVARLLAAMPKFLSDMDDIRAVLEALQSKETFEAHVREAETRSRAELEVADAELLIASDQIDRLSTLLAAKDRQLSEAGAEVQFLREQNAALAEERKVQEEHVEELTIELGRVQRALDEARERAEQNLARWDAAAREARDAERNLTPARAALRETEAALRASDGDRVRLREDRDALRRHIADLQRGTTRTKTVG